MATYNEWQKNVWRIIAGSGPGGELDTAYVVACGEKLAVIDTGSSEVMGSAIIDLITGTLHRGLDSLGAIFLTHAHPYVLGGLKLLAKESGAKIYVHENAKPVFDEGRNYVMGKQYPIKGTTEKLSLAWKTDLFSNYTDLPESREYVKGGTDVTIGDEIFLIEATGGHSSDSILIHAYKNRATFLGDELGIYPENEYNFYFDLTGSPEQRKKALRACARLRTDYIYSTHVPPIAKEDLDTEAQEAILAQEHFETTILETLSGYGKLKLPILAAKVTEILAIDWKSPFKELQVAQSTVEVYLKKYLAEKTVKFDDKAKVYSYVETEQDMDDSFY